MGQERPDALLVLEDDVLAGAFRDAEPPPAGQVATGTT
jgi:hypothetical protein